VGGVVCAVGAGSERRSGSCLSSIGGAYLGAASVVPLFLIGYGLDSAIDDNEGDVHIPVFTILLTAFGWFVVQPAMSIGAWSRFSHPRPGLDTLSLNPPPLPPPPRTAFAREHRRGLAMAPGQVSLPVLSLGF
jgi:hypothetical protein